ncbi:hypothetical protein V2J09_015103 [Rumex salicifolius]
MGYSRPILLLLLISISLHAPPAFADPTAPAPAPSTTDFDFIRESCNLTLYPDVCYTSLSRYATSVSRSTAEIARAAVSVSLCETRLASAYFSNLTRGSDPAASDCRAALRDCSSTLSSAASEIRGSFKQMSQLRANDAGARQIRFQISNVQTWMSAALTNEDTCTDGFESVSDGPLKSEVCDRVAIVRKLTSNALALVNFYASTVR